MKPLAEHRASSAAADRPESQRFLSRQQNTEGSIQARRKGPATETARTSTHSLSQTLPVMPVIPIIPVKPAMPNIRTDLLAGSSEYWLLNVARASVVTRRLWTDQLTGGPL